MIDPEKALKLVLEHVAGLPPEFVPSAHSVDRVLARDVRSLEDLPPFDNSSMDGFAVRSRDCSGARGNSPVVLAIRETVRAGGMARLAVRPGEAARIMTGAPIPPGADAVVMREAAEVRDGTVDILQVPGPGDYIRSRGEDIRIGTRILAKGTRIRPYEVALLAAQGIDRVAVARKPRVGILATGDELVDASEKPAPGQIRDSNGPALAAALSRWGAVPLSCGIVGDDRALLRKALARGLDAADMLLVSGGVSVGDFDYTRTLLEEMGLDVVFWRVAIKPGKPLLFGLLRGKPVFGLPGNPISALVCLEEFVRPALEKMQGLVPEDSRYPLSGAASGDYDKPKDRQQYLFCRAERARNGYRLRILRPQGSAMLGTACGANALAIAPIGASRIRKGGSLAFRWLK